MFTIKQNKSNNDIICLLLYLSGWEMEAQPVSRNISRPMIVHSTNDNYSIAYILGLPEAMHINTVNSWRRIRSGGHFENG